MNDLIEKLLSPVSPEQPCGPDRSYDPRFEELESILRGKPEIEIGSMIRPAEPPDWGELTEKSSEFLNHCKHLRVAVMLCCGWLQTGGFAGFRDGLQLVHGLLEKYWTTIYPLLDPEDNNDPTQRLNIIGSLTAPRGTSGWLRVVDYLYSAPLCHPKGMPPVTFEQLKTPKPKEVPTEGESTAQGASPTAAPDATKLASVLREAGGKEAAERHGALEQALNEVKAIDQFLTTTLGSAGTISFEVLETTLQEIMSALKPYLPGGAAEPGVSAETSDQPAPGATSIAVTGSIRSREDVVRAIDRICEYYRQVEPSSAVPYLLRRAQKLATMNFVQSVQELSLATVDGLRPSMGSALDSEIPPTTPSA